MKNRSVLFSVALRTTLIPKVIASLLTLSLLALLGGLMAGLANGELRAQVSLGLLIACALCTVAVCAAMRTPDSVFRFVRWSWIALTITVLVVAMAFRDHGGDTVVVYAMVVLAFPISVPVVPIVASLLGDTASPIDGLLAIWLSLLAAGYVQWFVVCERLFRQSGPSNPPQSRS